MKLTGVDPALCDYIPGLRATPVEVSGWPDAVAIAAQRGGKAPVLPPSVTTVAELEAVSFWGDLRPYQRHGVNTLSQMLKREGGAILADDMGLGKTAQTIGTWLALGSPAPVLVCAPASVRRTWVDQLKRWAGLTPVLVETGKQAGQVALDCPVVITSYELAMKLPRLFSPRMIVMDEAHLLRGRSAKRSLHMHELAKVAQYKLALTGTPMWSRPRDIWMILKILFGYRFGTANQFDEAYCGLTINKWGGKENKGSTRADELKKRLEWVMLRRTKAQVGGEMPKLSRSVRWVPGTKEARRACEANALGQLSLYDAMSATLAAKIDATVEAAVEAGKSLVLTWRRADAVEIQARCEAEGLVVELITGDMSHVERARAVTRAHSTGATVVATIDSTGTGVDGLQHVASVGIFHALDYVPIKLAQAEARLDRIGQTQPVTWLYMAMEGSADQYVIQTVVEKLSQWSDIFGKDGTSALGESIVSAEVEQSTEAALAAIKEAMRELA